MERMITYENLPRFAYSNDREIKGRIRAVVICFFGLGKTVMLDEPNEDALFFAARDVVWLYPYNNPWCWMNRQAVSYTDECVEAIFDHYCLPDTTPVISTGGSMGGQSALTYMAYARRTPAGCVVNCPVCDLPYHFTERPDLPRTLYSAFGTYDCGMEEALRSASPLHLAQEGRMPRAAYTVFHCGDDHAVNIHQHSDRFVEEMRKTRDIEYVVVPDRDHCKLGPEYYPQYLSAMLRAAGIGE